MTAGRLFDDQPYAAALELQPTASGAVDDTTLAAISESIVASRCLARGLDVSRPAADARGVDLLVAGRRVQVKSTRQPLTNRRLAYYRFKGGNGASRTNGRHERRFDELAQRCDVFAFYAHDTDRLWLMSSAAVRARWRSTAVSIRPDELAGLDDFGVFEDTDAG